MPTRATAIVTARDGSAETVSRNLGAVPAFGISGVPEQITIPGVDWIVDWNRYTLTATRWSERVADGRTTAWALPDIEFNVTEGAYTLNVFGAFNVRREPVLSNAGFTYPASFASGCEVTVEDETGTVIWDDRGRINPRVGDAGFWYTTLPGGQRMVPGTKQNIMLDGYHALPYLRTTSLVKVKPRLIVHSYDDESSGVGPDLGILESNAGVIATQADARSRQVNGFLFYDGVERGLAPYLDRKGY